MDLPEPVLSCLVPPVFVSEVPEDDEDDPVDFPALEVPPAVLRVPLLVPEEDPVDPLRVLPDSWPELPAPGLDALAVPDPVLVKELFSDEPVEEPDVPEVPVVLLPDVDLPEPPPIPAEPLLLPEPL